MASNGAEMKCPSCGERIYPNDQYCLSCGVRLDEGRLAGDDAKAAQDAQTAPRGQPMPETAFPADATGAAPNVADAAPGQTATREVSYATGPGRWDPSSVTGGRGFFDSLSRGWVFLKESIAMAFKDKDLFIPSVLAVVANLIIFGGLAGLLYLTGNFEALFSEQGEELTLVGYIIIFVIALISYIINYFFTGMTVHLVDVHLRGEDAQLGSAFADSVKNFGGIVALAVASLVVAMIASSIRGKSRSGLRRAAAATVERGWLAITYLLLPIMILEDSPCMKSADRARTLHGHNIIQIVVGELGLMLASRIISGVIIFIGVALAAGSFFLSPALLPVGIGVGVLLFMVASAFAAYVRAAFYTCMYLWAVAMETVGEEAPAPAPLRPAVSAGW
ncbi:MAG: hypothetical protein GF393_11465 [Armatimonadia bacterium]|nr:hypothetical protein [Armatimonadia bacterium]